MLPVKLLQSLLFLLRPVTHLHIQSYHYWGSSCIVFHSTSVKVKIGRDRGDEKQFRAPKGSSSSNRLGCCKGIEISFFFIYCCVWKAKPPLPSSSEKTHGWAGDCWKVHTHISLTRRRTWKHLFTSHWLHIEGTHFKKFNTLFLQQFWIQGPCLLKSTTTYYIWHGEITCRKKLMYTACRNNSYDCQSRSMFATILWAYETLVTISITTINPNELISYRWLYRLYKPLW